MDEREIQERVARIEELLDQVDAIADPHDRETAGEIVQALLDLYGEGLRRILMRADPKALADDDLVSHLLLLHGLHPVPPDARVRAAFSALGANAGRVELVRIDELGVARVRLHGRDATLEIEAEQAVRTAAPDLEGMQVEDDGAIPLPVWQSA
ncbi:MAG TPA: hypothetical protein VF752_09485 [Thermoleophilaceae bacterium]